MILNPPEPTLDQIQEIFGPCGHNQGDFSQFAVTSPNSSGQPVNTQPNLLWKRF